MSFDCMTKHDDVIIVCIHTEFFLAKFRHYFLFSLSSREQVREKDFFLGFRGGLNWLWLNWLWKVHCYTFSFDIFMLLFSCASSLTIKQKNHVFFLWFRFLLSSWFTFMSCPPRAGGCNFFRIYIISLRKT